MARCTSRPERSINKSAQPSRRVGRLGHPSGRLDPLQRLPPRRRRDRQRRSDGIQTNLQVLVPEKWHERVPPVAGPSLQLGEDGRLLVVQSIGAPDIQSGQCLELGDPDPNEFLDELLGRLPRTVDHCSKTPKSISIVGWAKPRKAACPRGLRRDTATRGDRAHVSAASPGSGRWHRGCRRERMASPPPH